VNAIKAFFSSSANRHGLTVWGATVLTALFQYFVLKQTPSESDLLGLVIGLGLIVAPDNTVTVAQLEKAVTDGGAALATKNPTAIAAAAADIGAIVEDVTKAPVAPAPAPVPVPAPPAPAAPAAST
jgi:hypothetical protein